jgi:hypothetical protein
LKQGVKEGENPVLEPELSPLALLIRLPGEQPSQKPCRDHSKCLG